MSLLRRYVIVPLSFLRPLLLRLHIPPTQLLVLVWLVQLLYLPFEQQYADGLERFRRELVQPVEPGNYVPRPCGEWRFLDETCAQLQSVFEGMQELRAETVFLTGNHVDFPSCVMLWHDEAMVNPRLVSEAGQTARFRITHRPLCGDTAHAYESDYYPRVQLEWYDVNAGLHTQRYEGTEARELQLALRILQGEDICPGT